MKNITRISAIGLALATGITSEALADKVDDIISAGTLRCAVTLDFAPMGSRDANNQPIGFDVDYCNDLGKALGVKTEIVETPFPDRVPALMSDRADVVIASTSDTLERAKVVGFSIPYMVNRMIVLTRKNTGISSYEDLKGKKLGNTASTYDSGNYPDLVITGVAPYIPDYYAIATKRDEFGFINYLNLFVHQQVRTGRYAELYKKWFKNEPVDLTIPLVYR